MVGSEQNTAKPIDCDALKPRNEITPEPGDKSLELSEADMSDVWQKLAYRCSRGLTGLSPPCLFK